MSNLLICINMLNCDFSMEHSFPNKVVVNFHMFGLGMKNWIFGQLDCTNVVTVDLQIVLGDPDLCCKIVEYLVVFTFHWCGFERRVNGLLN